MRRNGVIDQAGSHLPYIIMGTREVGGTCATDKSPTSLKDASKVLEGIARYPRRRR